MNENINDYKKTTDIFKIKQIILDAKSYFSNNGDQEKAQNLQQKYEDFQKRYEDVRIDEAAGLEPEDTIL